MRPETVSTQKKTTPDGIALGRTTYVNFERVSKMETDLRAAGRVVGEATAGRNSPPWTR